VADTGIVIVGGGLAGAKAAEALREEGYDGPLTLIGSEEHLPYERPPLSKGYLAGKEEFASAQVHDQAWYADQRIDLMLGATATQIDAGAHEVELVDGRRIPYSRLVLATGSTARRLPLPGMAANGVRTLRTVEDSDRLIEVLGEGGRLAVIGGGWIGMEVASNARERGVDVTVIEAADLPLAAALGPDLARVFLELHREHGVVFHLGAQVDEITEDESRATGVRLKDGTHVPADTVLVGVGAAPNLELAESAGVDIEGGVLVDPSLRTSDPDIWAVGDIAAAEHPLLGRRIRVEHWANALNQPATAARAILDKEAAYDELPYFFTDQYDLGMEYIGDVPRDADPQVVIRGDLAGREFIAFWLDSDDRVLAGMNVNVWDVVDDIKALIRSAKPVDTARLADPDVAIADV
jgi:3-phenylpropionate/trans-cinnamate dioxygenase ferredoxin reductase component